MPEPVVRMTNRLWSQEVALARAAAGEDLPERDVAYRFTRKQFLEPPPPPPPPPPEE